MTSDESRSPLPWREQARRIARIRRWSGALAALLLCLAAFALVDGLVALMRAGSTRIELIAGQSESLSGPVASKNPVSEDLRLRLTPETAPVEFRLEGFFPSYWFGNGMWRGVVSTPPDAAPGFYNLTVGFRGGGGSQSYDVVIWPDAAAQQAGALSLVRSKTGLSPLYLAPALALAGVIAGLLTWLSGRAAAALLRRHGLSEIFRIQTVKNTQGTFYRLWCVPDIPHSPLPERPNRATDVWRFPVERAASEDNLGLAVFSGRKGACISLDLPEGGPAPSVGDVVRLGGILPGSQA